MILFDKVRIIALKNCKKIYHGIVNRLLFILNDVQYDKFPKITGLVFIRNRGNLLFGTNVAIISSRSSNPVGGSDRTSLYVSPGGLLNIGNNVGLSNCTIFCQDKIIVEDNVLVGGGTQIYDSDFHSIDFKDRMARPDVGIIRSSVHIRKGVFVGASSIILKGVEIGEYSIIGAGSVVTKNVPRKEIWAGNPAKFIRVVEK